jgi:preprotein translocase subunit SecA
MSRQWIEDTIESALQTFTNPQTFPEEWDLEGLYAYVGQMWPLGVSPDDLEMDTLGQEELREILLEDAQSAYAAREEEMGSDVMRSLERAVMLEVLDNKWREHLYELDYLQEGIGLRGMAGRDPLVEYQSEAYDMFMSMLSSIKEEFSRYIYHAQMVEVEERPMQVFESGPSDEPTAKAEQRHNDKVGRNTPCPCGSGKKYKKCCGIAE